MLREFSVRLCTSTPTNDGYQFIVPVRAGTPEMAERYAKKFIEEFYGVTVKHTIVRYKGRALPTWCSGQRVKRTAPIKAPQKPTVAQVQRINLRETASRAQVAA